MKNGHKARLKVKISLLNREIHLREVSQPVGIEFSLAEPALLSRDPAGYIPGFVSFATMQWFIEMYPSRHSCDKGKIKPIVLDMVVVLG